MTCCDYGEMLKIDSDSVLKILFSKRLFILFYSIFQLQEVGQYDPNSIDDIQLLMLL